MRRCEVRPTSGDLSAEYVSILSLWQHMTCAVAGPAEHEFSRGPMSMMSENEPGSRSAGAVNVAGSCNPGKCVRKPFRGLRYNNYGKLRRVFALRTPFADAVGSCADRQPRYWMPV